MDLEQSLLIAKALGDRTRLHTLNALRAGPLCVEDLASRLGLASSTVSFHLKKLTQAGLVNTQRDQYYAMYSLSPRLGSLTLEDLTSFDNPEATLHSQRVADERRRVLHTFFSESRLTRMPAQKRKRDIVVEQIARLFNPGVTYAEHEVDDTIRSVFHDHCLARRLLVDEGYFTRANGRYTRTTKEEAVDADMMSGDDRKRMKQAYAAEEKVAGVFRIRNRSNERAFLGSAVNLHGPLNRIEFELRLGCFRNKELQADYTQLGAESFDFEVLDIVKTKDEPGFNVERELESMEQRYAAELDRTNTYNTEEDIRFLPRRKSS